MDRARVAARRSFGVLPKLLSDVKALSRELARALKL